MKKKILTMFLLWFFIAPMELKAEEEIEDINKNRIEVEFKANEKLSKYAELIDNYIKMYSSKNYKEAPSFYDVIIKEQKYKDEQIVFKDIKESDWYYNDVVFGHKLGYFSGKDSLDAFKPQSYLTRAELGTILNQQPVDSIYVSFSGKSTYKDLKEDHWAYNNLLYLNGEGIITGYEDGNIKPDNNITRAELVSVLERAMGKELMYDSTEKGAIKLNIKKVNFKDVSEKDWYYKSLKSLSEVIEIVGYEDKTFRPNNFVTRAETAAILTRYLNYVNLVKD